MFITPEELKTHLYEENVRLIQGDDDTIITAAIDGAQQEMRSYLAKYDRDKIFSAVGDQRNALLLIFIKDIAVWHFLTLCNAGADFDHRLGRYERAISWLKEAQRGNVSPDLPFVDDDGDGEDDSTGDFIFGSNPKRNQHF